MLRINLRTNIPALTGRNLRGIPPGTGFKRSTVPLRVGHTARKQEPYLLKAEKDKSLEEEILRWVQEKINGKL